MIGTQSPDTGVRWGQFFVTSLSATGRDGHIPASELRARIERHDGGEAYHCAFDLEPRDDYSGYTGAMRPALGYVWFDFDSQDGGAAALADVQAFIRLLAKPDLFVAYSGSKGFHCGVPFAYFGLEPGPLVGRSLHRAALKLKAKFPTLDTTIYNANRKFRVLGSRHPKTGLYKVALDVSALETATLDVIRHAAQLRGILSIPVPLEGLSPLALLVDLCADKAALTAPQSAKGVPKKEWVAPTGEAAFKQCGFLQHARDDAATLSEPEWYAALSIVSRFQEGRKQCHQLSRNHREYTAPLCNDKIDQALAESAPRTCENVSTLWSGCHSCELFGKINSPVNIYDRRFWKVETTQSGSVRLIPQYNELLIQFQKDYPYKTIADMKAVYVFKETHYAEFTPIETKSYAEQQFEPKPQEKQRQEFYYKVIANSVERRDFFTITTEDKLNFRNGVLELASSAQNSRTLLPHSPNFGFRHCLPYDFDPRAACPTFDWWIDDIMLGDKQLIAILQEYMGYVIRGGEYKYHKALWLSGSGRNGKSTFLSVLKALIGAGNYSTLSIRQIISDKFSSADLDGKIANFSEETSPEELSDSGPFKNLTGDGELNAQKKYGDPYSFRNRAKLIMTYNEVPELRDLSPGMLSRPIIVPWKKDLTDESAQDRNLKAKLLSELPGIFNFALRGWERLEEQGEFTESSKSAVELQNVRDASCSAMQWVSHYVTLLSIDANSSNIVASPTDLYEAYSATERFPYKAPKFWRRINAHPEIKKRRREVKKGTEYFALMIRQKASFESGGRSKNGSPSQCHDLPPEKSPF